MRYLIIILLTASFTILLNSCSGDKTKHKEFEPGLVLAADSMLIKEDALNELYFSARLETTEGSDSGRYRIHAAWGYNQGSADMTLPKDFEKSEPALRRDTGYTYIVGFRMEGDTTFHDYFRIAGEEGNLQMRYIKSYYFQ